MGHYVKNIKVLNKLKCSRMFKGADFLFFCNLFYIFAMKFMPTPICIFIKNQSSIFIFVWFSMRFYHVPIVSRY